MSRVSATNEPAPFLHADHVGSLLRPLELRQAFRDFNAGSLDLEEFRKVQDRCIEGVVKAQEAIGLRAVTDGEFRRQSYWSHFVDAVDGLDVAPARFEFRDDTGETTHFLSPHVTGKVSRAQPISGEEFSYLRRIATAVPKVTLPSPPTMHFWAQTGTVQAAGYTDDDAYLADLARVYAEELAELAEHGATYVQLDEVPLAMLCDGELRDRLEASGEKPDRTVQRYVDLMNACLAGRPQGLRIGLHLCRGNFKGRWLSDGGYEYVARKLFNEIEVDTFFLEYDTARAGGFEPLGAVPDMRSVVLGLVSTKVPVLEAKKALTRRIEEASAYVPLERLGLSPQCGFASTVGGNAVTEDDQWRKLELVVETAREVWGS